MLLTATASSAKEPTSFTLSKADAQSGLQAAGRSWIPGHRWDKSREISIVSMVKMVVTPATGMVLT